MAREIILYSAKMCSDCMKLKDYMDAQGIAYEYRDIKEVPSHAEYLEEKTGKLGVPYLVIDGQWVRGYPTDAPFSEEFAAGLFA